MDNNINNCEDYVAPWKQTKYLVLSSSFFISLFLWLLL